MRDLIELSDPHAWRALRYVDLINLLLAAADLEQAIAVVLKGAIGLQGADFGTVHLLRSNGRTLSIAAQHGFDVKFLDAFHAVEAGDGSVCGRAMARLEPVIVHDVREDTEFGALVAVAETAGFRAVQSTPLIALDGEFLGVVSTHFRRPHTPCLPKW